MIAADAAVDAAASSMTVVFLSSNDWIVFALNSVEEVNRAITKMTVMQSQLESAQIKSFSVFRFPCMCAPLYYNFIGQASLSYLQKFHTFLLKYIKKYILF